MTPIEEQKSALAWMKAQALAIDPNLKEEDQTVSYMARIISRRIILKKRRISINRKCLCEVIDVGLANNVQLHINSHCPFHKQYIKKKKVK